MMLSDLILDLHDLRKQVGNVEVAKIASSKTQIVVIIKRGEELEAATLKCDHNGIW
jgi:hypothetical protein